MTTVEIIVLVVVAGVVGMVGQAISGFSSRGLLVSVAVGLVGGFIGLWLSRELGLPELFAISIGGTRFPIIWSIIGSALFVAVIALISGRRT